MRTVPVVIGVSLACVAAATAAPGATIVQDCDGRIEVVPPNKLPVPGPLNLTLGPVTVAGFLDQGNAKVFRRLRHGDHYEVKAVLTVRADTTATLSGRGLRFAFGLGATGGAVRFTACDFSYGRVTGFAGNVLVARPGCYALELRSGGRTYKRTISLGAGRC